MANTGRRPLIFHRLRDTTALPQVLRLGITVVATVVMWCLSVFAFDFQLFASAFLVVTRWLPLLGVLLFLELGLLALIAAAWRKRRVPEP